MAQLKLTDSDLAAALVGFEFEKGRIEGAIREIREILGDGRSEPATSAEIAKPRKKRSAAVRRRMKIAQQLRWRKIKEAAEPLQAKPAERKKRQLSARGRKNIVAATKRRWAAVKAAKEASKSAVEKKAAAKKAVAKKTAPRKPVATKRSTKAAKRVVAAKAKKVNDAPEQPAPVGA